MPIEWVFWIATAATVYAYVGYPLLLAVVARLSARELVLPRRCASAGGDDDHSGAQRGAPHRCEDS